jgi:ComF family protein
VQAGACGNKGEVQRAIALLKRGANAVVDFALPPRCAGCGCVVEELDTFCVECWPKVDWLGDDGCGTCGLPLQATDAERCARCMAAPPVIARTRAAIAYGDMARTVVLKLKYGRRVALARMMGRHMARLVKQGDADDALLVPVPLHRGRLWSRGYNQSLLIAAQVEGRTAVPLLRDGMRRVRRTKPLKGMTIRQRSQEVRGAFEVVRPEAVKGRRIVLVDDVLTTGSTAEACAKALLKAGAREVELICFARVVRPLPL